MTATKCSFLRDSRRLCVVHSLNEGLIIIGDQKVLKLVDTVLHSSPPAQQTVSWMRKFLDLQSDIVVVGSMAYQ
jgi:hypothetical protein